MNFHILHPSRPIKQKLSVVVKGIVNGVFTLVPYRSIVDDGDWTPYFGSSVEERQKFGRYDSNSCWEFSVVKGIELQLNALKARGEFTNEALIFFRNNKIIGDDGFFNISDQFYDILSGNLGNGGTAEECFQLIQKYGMIGHDALYCTDAIANQYSTQSAFDNYYYNKNLITQAMFDVGAQSKKYFNLQYQRIGSMWTTPDKTTLSAAIRQAPLAYGVPVNGSTWNQVTVPALIMSALAHEVTGYRMTQLTVGYPVLDNYRPFCKGLDDGYSINSVMQGVITAIVPPVAIPTPAPTLTVWQSVWIAVHNWLESQGLITSLGKV
jgi:hypothetical protein